MAANPENWEKTDELVTAYLHAIKGRVSGAAFKIAFEVAMRWRYADEEEVRISIAAFEDETGCARNTVRSAIAEAHSLKVIVQSLDPGGAFVYRPDFEGVQKLTGSNFNRVNFYPGQKLTPPEKLFSFWMEKKGETDLPFDSKAREAAKRILETKPPEEVERALAGYAGFKPDATFAEAVASPEAVEQGIIYFEFLEEES